jgi:hypothetical protein
MEVLEVDQAEELKREKKRKMMAEQVTTFNMLSTVDSREPILQTFS